MPDQTHLDDSGALGGLQGSRYAEDIAGANGYDDQSCN